MYLKRLLFIVIIVWLAGYTGGCLFDYLYKKRWAVMFFDKTEELIHGKNNYDILFLGNSRVHFGINPYYIDSITGVKSYNFGNGGADAQTIMLVSDIYLQYHNAPVLVVISVDMSALTKREILKTYFYYL